VPEQVRVRMRVRVRAQVQVREQVVLVLVLVLVLVQALQKRVPGKGMDTAPGFVGCLVTWRSLLPDPGSLAIAVLG